MAKPELSTIPEWYHRYVNLVKEDSVTEALEQNTGEALAFLRTIPEEQWTYRYAEGKWSIKEMVQHLIDSERIFAYRALCMARGEKQSLPGFDENAYAASSNADRRSPTELLDEFAVARQSTAQLFASFNEAQLASAGIANKNPVTVVGVGFIIPGHVKHHLNVLHERYGV